MTIKIKKMIEIFFKFSFIVFLNFVFIIYSLEILTSIFIMDRQVIQNHNEMLQEAKKNKELDTRGDFEAFIEERKKFDLHPVFRQKQNFFHDDNLNDYFQNFILQSFNDKKKIPFRGPFNKFSLGSNEEGVREIITNDKYGYVNFNEVYDKNIDILIIGDSMAEGLPFDNNDNISGVINKKTNFNSINLGIGGSGPLTSLGVLKEYGKYFKPKNIIYLFFEGNDLADLLREKDTFLVNYVNNNFNQDLFNSTAELELFYKDYENLFNKILPKLLQKENELKNKPIMMIDNKVNFKEKLKDILELQSLKKIMIPKDYYLYKKEMIDYKLFEKILLQMNSETRRWNGKFYFVYLPDWNRYNMNFSLSHYLLKKKIMKINEKNKFNFIDIDREFKKRNYDNINIFNNSLYGHYTKKGFEIISDVIIEKIN